MSKRKKKTKKQRMTGEERRLKKCLMTAHQMLVPTNVQSVLGNSVWNLDCRQRPEQFEKILVETIITSSRATRIEDLQVYILNTKPDVRLQITHQAYVYAIKVLPLKVFHSEKPVELTTEVLQWYERMTRNSPTSPPDEGPKRDTMAAALQVA